MAFMSIQYTNGMVAGVLHSYDNTCDTLARNTTAALRVRRIGRQRFPSCIRSEVFGVQGPSFRGKRGSSGLQNVDPTKNGEREWRNSNPSELLLQKWQKESPTPSTSEESVTELCDRLFLWDSVPKLAGRQTFSVYELNEHDRDSPAFLPFSTQTVNRTDPVTNEHVHALGDMVPFTNKLYDGSLRLRLGITTGICLLCRNYPGKGTTEHKKQIFFTPDRYETFITFYFGDLGQISLLGPFINFQDTLMTVTGGVGFFKDAKGVVRLHNLTPFKFFYTFHLEGIPELPRHLTAPVVAPHVDVVAIPDAVACKPGFALSNYSD